MSTDAIFRGKDGLENEIEQLIPETVTAAHELAGPTTAKADEQLLGVLGMILVAIILGLSAYCTVVYLL